eukprot:2557516-Pyramimonas_sp.AAC.1
MSRARLAPQQEESCLIEEVGDEMMLLEESTETIYMLAFKGRLPPSWRGGSHPKGGSSSTQPSWRPS